MIFLTTNKHSHKVCRVVVMVHSTNNCCNTWSNSDSTDHSNHQI